MKAKTVLAACTILCGLVAALLVPAVVRADAGIRDRAYTAGTNGPPTTSKPESKLWFNDGSWWAVMAKKVTPTNNDYHIFRLNLSKQRWIDTGVLVDSRDSTRQDVLSTGNKLFIASHKFVPISHFNPAASGDDMVLSWFSYNGTKYNLGGTTTINAQKSETLVIDRDSTNAIWATWAQEDLGGQHHVYVSSTTGSCASTPTPGTCSWSAPTSIDDVTPDDISSVVRVGSNKVGVAWSNTTDVNNDRILFAVHQDGDPVANWSAPETAVGGRKMADDHINLKTDSSGRVYAVTKTKFKGETNPGTMLLRRGTGGKWKHFTVTRASLDHTRPIVLLDEQHNRIRVFEGSTHNTAIFMKTSRLDHPSFPVLRAGARVIQDSGSEMANPTSTKQRISNKTRLIVLATNPDTKHYWHAYLRIKPRHR